MVLFVRSLPKHTLTECQICYEGHRQETNEPEHIFTSLSNYQEPMKLISRIFQLLKII